MKEITIRQATDADTIFISQGFHDAMLLNDTPQQRIQLFADKICSRNDVLYSAKNTLIAEMDGKAVGMITSYDGKGYHDMRTVTMSLIKEHLGIEFPGMEDEAEEGEYYLDSLAVLPEYRGHGIGRMLLSEAIHRGHEMNLPVTLVVDPANPRARKLYESLGFKTSREMFLFGHTYMKMVLMP